GRRRHGHAPALALRARPPIPVGRRRAEARRHAALARHGRRCARGGRRPPAAAVQRSRSADVSEPRNRIELVATFLLAIATVATAWSGYQSTRWNGEQAKSAARANAYRIESAKAAG